MFVCIIVKTVPTLRNHLHFLFLLSITSSDQLEMIPESYSVLNLVQYIQISHYYL